MPLHSRTPVRPGRACWSRVAFEFRLAAEAFSPLFDERIVAALCATILKNDYVLSTDTTCRELRQPVTLFGESDVKRRNNVLRVYDTLSLSGSGPSVCESFTMSRPLMLRAGWSQLARVKGFASDYGPEKNESRATGGPAMGRPGPLVTKAIL